MGRSERDKGRKGEREVAGLFALEGLEVRGLEAAGDHLVVCGAGGELVVHSEVKRQETARVWLWREQAIAEAPPGSIAAVTFRRNRSPWLTLLDTRAFARLLRLASGGLAELIEAGNELAEELEPYAAASPLHEEAELRGKIARWDAARRRALGDRGELGSPTE